MNNNTIIKLADTYLNECEALLTQSQAMRMKGKYRVVLKNDKNLANDKELDLTDVEEFSYSAIVRKLKQKATDEELRLFLTLYKKQFDKAVREKLQKPEKVALQNAVIKFKKSVNIKFPKKMIKNAALSELGDAVSVGNYLANIVKFTLNRISPQNRPKSLASLKQKLYALNESELAGKNLPASSAMGQSITFVKHVLFNHDPSYIREVLNNLVRNL